ncbi:hypothetical protein D3C84_683840 [compost metagenome]
MVDLIKERRDIRIQYPVHLLTLQRDRQRIQRIVLATSRPKPIRESQKVLFIDRIQNGNDCLLYDLVLQRGNAQRALPAIGFGNVDPPRWRCSIGSTVEPCVQISYPLEKTFLVFPPRHAVHAYRCIAAQGIETLRQ